LFYQWQQNGTNLSDGGNVSGSAARVLTLNNITSANGGTYSVIVSNSPGWVESRGAALVVEEPPVFLTATPVGGTIAFTWSAIAGHAYQVQSTTNLSLGGWTNLNGAVTASNSVMGASDALSPNSQKFYRVEVQLP
jgi:hypothetical protein